MEEIFLLILQFLLEIILQVAFWIPFEFMRTRTSFLFFAGAASGAVSLLLRPQHIMPIVWLRTVNLAVMPVVFAYFTQWAEQKISRLKNEEESLHTFFDIYVFVFIFTLVRYVFAK